MLTIKIKTKMDFYEISMLTLMLKLLKYFKENDSSKF